MTEDTTSSAATKPNAADSSLVLPQFWVVTDGACDYPISLKPRPLIVPVNIAIGNDQFASSELSTANFYARLKTNPHVLSTSQPSLEQFACSYRSLVGQAILSLHVSSAMSGTINAAAQGAHLVTGADVHLLDTKSVSVGMTMQVYVAAMAAHLGVSPETALAWVEQTRQQTSTIFTLGSLAYLRRSGRISSLRALFGAALDIKPVIEIERHKGSFKSLVNARGFHRAVEMIVLQMQKIVPVGTPLRVLIGYGEDKADADDLESRIAQHYPLHWLQRVQVGSALAVHSGPRVVGLAFAPNSWAWE